jgi:RimJ/RimL family protein N-acetyltransferase
MPTLFDGDFSPHAKSVLAEVHEDNTASRALFSAAGYLQYGQDGPFLRLGLAL